MDPALSRASFKNCVNSFLDAKQRRSWQLFSMSNVADAEHALSVPLSNAEAIYRANLDMKGFHQEVVRFLLLDGQHPLHHERRYCARNRE